VRRALLAFVAGYAAARLVSLATLIRDEDRPDLSLRDYWLRMAPPPPPPPPPDRDYRVGTALRVERRPDGSVRVDERGDPRG
jgi:hypothetical protein